MILMNSWNRPCDYRLTVSRAGIGFSRRKPAKSRHPITTAGCRRMTGDAKNSSLGASPRRKRSSTWKIIFQKSHGHLLFLISFRPTLQVLPFLLFFLLPRATTLPSSLSDVILRYRPTANTGFCIIARADAECNADWGFSGISFQFACRSILIRKSKTIRTAEDDMPRHRETARVHIPDWCTNVVCEVAGTLGNDS